MKGRITRWLAATLALAVVAALGGWFVLQVLWPQYRPGLERGERYGLDVSSHQGRIDWPAVAGDDIDAVYIKASEGATYRDEHFADNWRDARAAGLDVGAYHFFTLCKEGEEQAANLLGRLREVGATASDLPPVVDLELDGNCSQRPAADVLEARLRAFVTEVEAATGQQLVLYTLEAWEQRYPVPADLRRDRWVRRLALRPDGDWAWWQASNRARVDGVDGPVDLNVVAAR
ncbi:MAG: GH25 family lysozyme [Phycicoccus sp.]